MIRHELSRERVVVRYDAFTTLIGACEVTKGDGLSVKDLRELIDVLVMAYNHREDTSYALSVELRSKGGGGT